MQNISITYFYIGVVLFSCGEEKVPSLILVSATIFISMVDIRYVGENSDLI